MAALLRLLKAKWNPPSDPQTSFTGKTVLVTGANTGIGFEAALKFTALDSSKVILGVRDRAKGERAQQLIEQRTHRYNVVEVWELDLNRYESIQGFADRINRTLDRLDVVVLNAGVRNVQRRFSPQGWEETLQVNLLSTALLALLLLPKLKTSSRDSSPTNSISSSSNSREPSGGQPVLQFVSSSLYQRARLPVDAQSAIQTPTSSSSNPILAHLNELAAFRGGPQYAVSKLLLMHVMLALAEAEARRAGCTPSSRCSNHAISAPASAGSPHRCSPQARAHPTGAPHVVVTSVSPGLCRSDLGRAHDGRLLTRWAKAVVGFLLCRTAEQGARSLVSGVALGPKAHGMWWHNDVLTLPAAFLLDDEGVRTRERVWFEVVDALRRDVPAVIELARQAVG